MPAARYDLHIEQGASLSKQIIIKVAGVPKDLTGLIPYGEIRKTHRSPEVIAEMSFDIPTIGINPDTGLPWTFADGRMTIKLTSAQTAAIVCGELETDPRSKYVYDIELSGVAAGVDIETDGNFATNPGPWTLGTGWTIDTAHHMADHAIGVGGESAISQDCLTGIASQGYTVVWTVSNRTQGYIYATAGGAIGTVHHLDGTYTEVITSPAVSPTTTLSFTSSADFDGSISNISVQIVVKDAPPNVMRLMEGFCYVSPEVTREP